MSKKTGIHAFFGPAENKVPKVTPYTSSTSSTPTSTGSHAFFGPAETKVPKVTPYTSSTSSTSTPVASPLVTVRKVAKAAPSLLTPPSTPTLTPLTSTPNISVQMDNEIDDDIWPPPPPPCSSMEFDDDEEPTSVSDANLAVAQFLQDHVHNKSTTKETELNIGWDMEEPPTIEFLRSTYLNWKKETKSTEELSLLSKSKQGKWKMKLSCKAVKTWTSNFPWIQFITVDGFNAGALCKVCRNIDSEEFQSYKTYSLNKSKGKWVTVPFVHWGDLTEAAKKHEFGYHYEKTGVTEIKELRKKIVEDGTAHIPSTFHMQIHMKNVTKEKAMTTKNTVVDSIKKSEKYAQTRQEVNEMAYEKTISLLHRTIKRRDSPFASLKDAIKFQRDVMGNDFFSVVLRHIDANKDNGVSHRLISEMVDSTFDAVNLAIYKEMCAGLVEGESIVFGSSIDTGTKVKKSKNYAGVGVKYFSYEEQNNITRGIGFLKTPRKDGIHLLQALKDTFERFNKQIERLHNELGDDLFPVHLRPLPSLQFENMDSMSVDGALISKDKMINKRVLACNPRTIVTWCADHRVNLTISDGLADERIQECYDVCVKLFDLTNASSRTEDLFLRCQESTGESSQFKAKNAVCLGDRPMHRWESSQKFNTKVMKLILSVEAYLAEIKVQKIANNAKQTKIYPAHYIARKFMKPYFLVTLAMETDVLDILVSFIKNTEFSDSDLINFLDESENVTLDLMDLKFEKGHTNAIINRITKGDLQHIEGGGNDLDVDEWKSIFTQTKSIYVENWKRRFSDGTDGTNLSMYLIFSVSKFRKVVGKNLERWELFASEYTDKLVNYFCKEVSFTATYPEDLGKTFVACPIGEEEELRTQVKQYCREVSRHYMDINPETQEVWKTKEMLCNMLCKDTPVWLLRNSILHRIMMSYMSLMFESADNERIMSSHTLLDSKLNQASKPKRVEQMVVIHKESASWKLFDAKAALLLWRMSKSRKVSLPPMRKKDLFQKDKSMIKTIGVIKKAHNDRLEAWKKKFAVSHDADVDADRTINSDSDENEDENEDEIEKKDDAFNKNAAEEDGYESDEIGDIHIDAESSDEDDKGNETVINNQDGAEFSEVEDENEAKAKQEDEFGSNTSEVDKGEESKDDEMVSALEEKVVESRKQEEKRRGKEEMRNQDGKEKEIKQKAKNQTKKKGVSKSKGVRNQDGKEKEIKQKAKNQTKKKGVSKGKLFRKSMFLKKTVQPSDSEKVNVTERKRKESIDNLGSSFGKKEKREVYNDVGVQLKKLHKCYSDPEPAMQLTLIRQYYETEIDTLISCTPVYDKCKTDELATALIPEDVVLPFCNPVAVKTHGNGNCLFNACSIFLIGNDSANGLLRLMTSIEFYGNAHKYSVDHKSIAETAKSIRRNPHLLFPDILSNDGGQDNWYKNGVAESAIRAEAIRTSVNYTYSCLGSVMALASVIKRPIHSLYPNVKYSLRDLFNRVIEPVSQETYTEAFHVLWTRIGKLDDRRGAIFVPDHFVPVIDNNFTA